MFREMQNALFSGICVEVKVIAIINKAANEFYIVISLQLPIVKNQRVDGLDYMLLFLLSSGPLHKDVDEHKHI